MFDAAATREILEELDRNGYVHIPGVLAPQEVAELREVVEPLAQEHFDAEQGFTHALGAAYLHPRLMDLAVDPRLMGVLAGALPPTLPISPPHIDVHPPEEDKPNAWRWHEDAESKPADLDYRERLWA